MSLLQTPSSVWVDPGPRTGGSDEHGTGDPARPFRTVERALQEVRAGRRHGDLSGRAIVLQRGNHFLKETVALGPEDSGLTFTAAPGLCDGDVVVSGGVLLEASWSKSSRPSTANHTIWVTKTPFDAIPGLSTLNPHRRVTRAREPDASPAEGAELCTSCWHNGVTRWHKDLRCVGKAKTIYIDLRGCDADKLLPDGSPCKNDSAMWDTYNTYSNGHGGCCGAWPGDSSPFGPMGNYFCGNSSAGGWVGFNDPRGNPGDPGYNGSQGLSAQLPFGFDFDPANDRQVSARRGPFNIEFLA